MESPLSSATPDAGATSFGAWVKGRRRALGLTQGDLARRVGCAEVTVRKIEADERRPSVQIAALLAEQLALAPAERGRFLLAARAALSPEGLPEPQQRPARLPAPPTPLLGREAEVEAILAALARPEVRLLTLSGPPGIGKTRLSLEVARRAQAPFGDSVSFVPLAPLRDPELLAAALAQALEVTPGPDEPALRRLIARLQSRQLLVLDNFEHVLPAAPLVAELLAHTADLKIIVTSRAALRLRAEHEHPVPPLALSASPGDAPGADLAASPAVRLFVERAQAVSHGFRLTEANAAAVAAICARLDGLPLAIELAAARARALSPQALLERLGRRLDLLTDGPADLPPRQRTLRAAIAWSHELLGADERRLLAWLAVFRGGWALDDLEGVLSRAAASGAPAEAPAPARAADMLATLIDHSLVRAAADERGALRFDMLETVREFAHERLADLGAGALAARAHAEHYAALAAAAAAMLTTDARGHAIARAATELDNLRAALGWALEEGDHALAVELVRAQAWLWHERDHVAEGRAWLARLLALPALTGPSLARAQALDEAANLALHQGTYGAGVALAREALALFQALGDGPGQASARGRLAWGLGHQGDHAETFELAQATADFWRRQGDAVRLGEALAHLGWCLQRAGDLPGADAVLREGVALLRGGPHTWLLAELCWHRSFGAYSAGNQARGKALLEESLALMRPAAAEGELADLLHIRAWDAYRTGDFAQAAALFDENAELLRRRGGTVDLAWAINHGADARRCLGEYEAAAAGYEQSLAIFRAHGHRQGEAAMLHNLGYVARARGDLAGAARDFAASLATFGAIGHAWSSADAVIGLAGVAAERGDAAAAARLLAAAIAAQAALDASGGLIEPANLRERERTLAAVAARLSPDERAAAEAAGAAMGLAEATELAAGTA